MRFHSMKMAEINKIIKDLWMKIYKGGGTLGWLDKFYKCGKQGEGGEEEMLIEKQ